MRSPLSRRSLLLFGASGVSLGLLSGCGLRLDSEPEVPTLDATEQLRNRIARILAATTPGDGDPETAGEDLQKFRDAIGAEWAPPSELATEPPPTEDARSFIEAAEVVSQSVFETSSQLDSALIPVLSDVATGLSLTAGTKKPELIGTAEELIRQGRKDADGHEDGNAQAESTESAADGADAAGDDGDTDIQDAYNAILNQARAAAYGYERLAVHFETKSAERRGAIDRLDSLGSLSGEMLENLGEKNADPNASAWKLDPSPTDVASARELALNLEDALAAAILPWLQTETAGILRLWESARARTIFADPQPLRYDYSGDSGEAEAQQ
ncbi:MAG: hypothetical protein ACTH2U_17580 [Brevibacterium sp.]